MSSSVYSVFVKLAVLAIFVVTTAAGGCGNGGSGASSTGGTTTVDGGSPGVSGGTTSTGGITASGGGTGGDSSNSGSSLPAPSCALGGPGMTNCGPGGSGTESCCTSLDVPGGTFSRTYDRTSTGESELPADGVATGLADPATVSSFRLDKYDVTVGRFRQFVNAWNAGWLPSAGSGKHTHLNGGQGLADSGNPGTYETGWVASDNSQIALTNDNLVGTSTKGADPYATWTNTEGTQESLPMNCVNWYEAYAFCIWDGGFLPSEVEWEYSAAGGNLQRESPWGSTTPGTTCPGVGCQIAIYNCNYPSGSRICTGVANIAPVGYASLGAGAWGQLDMVGEIVQWNLDWYKDDDTLVSPCTDCAYLAAASGRVMRGGIYSAWSEGANLSSVRRMSGGPSGRTGMIGFRCARTPGGGGLTSGTPNLVGSGGAGPLGQSGSVYSMDVSNIGGSGTIDVIVSATEGTTSYTGSAQFTVLGGASYSLTVTTPWTERTETNVLGQCFPLTQDSATTVNVSIPGTPSNIGPISFGPNGCSYYQPTGAPTVTLVQQ